MKKIYSLLSIVLLTASVSTAQVNIQDYNSGTPTGASLNGTVITRSAGADELVVVDLGVTNISGSDKNYDIQRVRINEVAAWSPSEQICWGYQVEGNCYSVPFISPNPWTSPAWGSGLPNNASANLKFDIHTTSVDFLHYRFYILEGSSKIDSVDVIINPTLGIKESKNQEVSMSVYPNPVSSVMTISTQGLNGNFDVKVTDVLGKVVYNESVSGTTKKLDVSDFKNGVYLVTVLEKGVVVQTKRVVIKH